LFSNLLGVQFQWNIQPLGDAFTDILVKFNPGYHSYSNAVGL